MKIESLTPENDILLELGRRLTQVRKQQGYIQQDLADKAGIGVATLRRIEHGQDSQLESWLKLLKALEFTHSIEQLLPENFDSPMAEVLGSRKRRRQQVADATPAWGDESP